LETSESSKSFSSFSLPSQKAGSRRAPDFPGLVNDQTRAAILRQPAGKAWPANNRRLARSRNRLFLGDSMEIRFGK
jgi:hypothetical protein